MNKTIFSPKIYKVWQEKGFRKNLSKDISAGVITGIIALPLAIAFGIASGATPEQGLFSAIIGGFLISVFSGSRVQIGGPTGAFIVVVYTIIRDFGMQGLFLATIMAGILLILFGLLKLGSIIKFIPYPVTQGFTSGIAILIAVTQLNDFFGFPLKEIPSSIAGRLSAYATSLPQLNPTALFIGISTIGIIIMCKKVLPKFPGSLLAVILLSLIVYCFSLNVETIGVKFGVINNSFPSLGLPSFNLDLLIKLLPSAFTIAILGAIESLLSAVVADGMTGMRHHSNTELIAQGISNIITPLFGGIPTTGAIARTATNIQNGGRTPLAGIVHAITLLVIVIFLGSYASDIPLAILAGILLVVAVGMSEYKLFIKMFRAPKSDILVMLTTFFLTIFVDLTVAIPTGVVLASLMFMRRMEQVAGGEFLDNEDDIITREDDPFAISNFTVPVGVRVYEINGPFFFGAAKRFQDAVIQKAPRVLILRMRNVNAIDATGLFALEDIIKACNAKNCIVLISAIHPQPLAALTKSGIPEILESKQIFPDIDTALKYASSIINNTTKTQYSSK